MFAAWREALSHLFMALFVRAKLKESEDASPRCRSSAPAAVAISPKKRSEEETRRRGWLFFGWRRRRRGTTDEKLFKETSEVRHATFWVNVGEVHIRSGRKCEDRCVCAALSVSPSGINGSTTSLTRPSPRRSTKVYEVFVAAAIDGHGGDGCASFISKSLPFLVEARLKKALMLLSDGRTTSTTATKVVAEKVAADALKDAEEGYREAWARDMGSFAAPGACLVVAVVIGETVGVANVGDARCVAVYDDGSTYVPTILHRASSTEDEATRVRAAGGAVSKDGRVAGGLLEPTRTLGDFEVKDSYPNIVSSEPHRNTLLLHDKKRRLRALVLATDGVCDFLEPEDIATFVLGTISQIEKQKTSREAHPPPEIAKNLVDLARSRGSTDDATAVVLEFHHDETSSLLQEAGSSSPSKYSSGGPVYSSSSSLSPLRDEKYYDDT